MAYSKILLSSRRFHPEKSLTPAGMQNAREGSEAISRPGEDRLQTELLQLTVRTCSFWLVLQLTAQSEKLGLMALLTHYIPRREYEACPYLYWSFSLNFLTRQVPTDIQFHFLPRDVI